MAGPFGSSQWMYASGGGGFYDYEIDGSLRFNAQDSAYLSRTPSAGDRQKFTFSAWMKLGDFDNWPQSEGYIFSVANGTDNTNNFYFKQVNGGQLRVSAYSVNWRATTAIFRDPSAWYHVVLACDSTQATAQNRIRLYINGEEVTAWDINNAPSQNQNFAINMNAEHRINQHPPGYNYPWGGYMAEVNFVDGQQLTPSSFGETKSGVWIPKAYSGSYGTNGFHLEFAGNANDSSGNGNNWTANNIGSWDYVPDSPTNNFCTLNQINTTNNATLREGCLELFNGANDQAAAGTFGITSGKWYWEVYYPTNDCPEVGVMPVNQYLSSRSTVGTGTVDGLARITNGTTMRDPSWASVTNTGLTAQTSYGTVRVVLDADNGKLWVSDLGGTYPNSGNPATGTNPQGTFDSDWVYQTGGVTPFALVATGTSQFCIFNFGQDSTFADQQASGGYSDENGYGDFTFAVPSGYLALCTANLSLNAAFDPAEDASPQDHFSTLLYTGDGSTSRSLTGVGFTPDLGWFKNRGNGSRYHLWADTSRGVDRQLFSNVDVAEESDTSQVKGFLSDGYTIGNNLNVNQSGNAHVTWNWKFNGAGSSVTFPTTGGTGSISGTRSVNSDTGMSLITYTSASSDPGDTRIEHGLGVAPDLYITKCRTAGSNWNMYHRGAGVGRLKLNSTDGYDSGWNGGNGVDPNSTYISMNWQTQSSGAYRDINEQSRAYVMYCFTSVEGFSKFGNYSANNAGDGPFIYLGFRPAFLIIRSKTTARDWLLYDSERNAYNNTGGALQPNTSGTAYTGSIYEAIDFLSNGFKLRTNGTPNMNANGESYVYIAFAENPFKYANAR